MKPLSSCSQRSPVRCILPPFLLDRLVDSPDPVTRRWALQNAAAAAAARATRRVLATLPAMAALPSPQGKKHRQIYDAKNKESLPGVLIRTEGEKASNDLAVNEAYAHSGDTYDFYQKVFQRNSLDDRGMALVSSVHVGRRYANAFWNGEQMAYGDGDGRVFTRFTKSLDVVAHELTHGVVTHTANLDYEDEPGALNEHFADVMATLVKQWRRKQTVTQADWFIGSDILVTSKTRRALRSLSAPGSAYVNDLDLGSDPQPKHMKDKYTGPDDYGGVHINSGIPNHAFYLAATRAGGHAWEKTGRVWYAALRSLSPRSDFRDAARVTIEKAAALYGRRSAETSAVQSAWTAVGVSR